MARHIIVCRRILSAPSADAYTIISAKHRHHQMARPCFGRGKTVRDRSHRAANHPDERGGDMQPFQASHFFATHEMRSDIENRERDRDQTFLPRRSPRTRSKIRVPRGRFIWCVQFVVHQIVRGGIVEMLAAAST